MLENYSLDEWPSNNYGKAESGSANYTQQLVRKCLFIFCCSQEFSDGRTQTQLLLTDVMQLPLVSEKKQMLES